MLGLGFDATDMDPMDVKTAFRMLALRYHPVTRTRMTLRQHHQACMNRNQATAHFQLLNMAKSYLRSDFIFFFVRVPNY